MNYQQDHITFIAQTCRFKVNRHLIEKHDNYLSALARLPQNIFNDFTKAIGQQLYFWGQDVRYYEGNLLSARRLFKSSPSITSSCSIF